MEILKFNKAISPVDVIEGIRQKSFDPDQFDSLDGYLEFLAHSIWKFQSVGIQIPVGSLEYKCSSVVDQLVAHGFIEIV